MTMAANLLQVHVRVILTPTATDCVHALFGVYTKYIKQGGVSFSCEDDSSPVTLTSNTHKSTKMLPVWPPATALCCCKRCSTKHSVTKSGPWGAPYCLGNHCFSAETLSSKQLPPFYFNCLVVLLKTFVLC